MSRIHLGRLRHRVTRQRPSKSRDDRGRVTATYTDSGPYPARVETIRATERVAAGEHRAEATHRVTLRAEADPQGPDRWVWDGRTLETVAVVADPVGEWATLECREINP